MRQNSKYFKDTWQVQVAHLENPNGGIYGCQRDPAGWKILSPSKRHPDSPISTVLFVLHEGQHWPSDKNGLAQLTWGQRMSSQTTFPLRLAFNQWALNKQRLLFAWELGLSLFVLPLLKNILALKATVFKIQVCFGVFKNILALKLVQ